jgi:peptide/nickel transport system substrate-binding protein
VNRSRVDYYITPNVFDTLVTYGRNYVPVGMLAERWERPDPGTWIFHLRTGVRFHDGTPFDAQAAKYSLEKAMAGLAKGQLTAVQGITAVDPSTLQIKVSTPAPTLPAILTQPYTAMVSPTAYDRLGPDGFARAPVGTGPFRLVSWDTASGEVILQANLNYWRKADGGQKYPYLQRVDFKVLPDVSAQVAALQAGDVDLIVKVPAASARQLGAGPQTKLSAETATGWVYSFLNPNRPVLADVHRRRAIQFAIDRTAIVQAAEGGYATPALGPIAPASWAYDPGIERRGFYGPTADVDKAKQELARANPPGAFEFTWAYPNDEPWSTIAPIVQDELAKVGIKAKLDGREIGAVLDDMFVGKFEALMIDWSGRIDEDLSMAFFFECGAGRANFTGYCDREVDRMLKEAGSTTDRGKRTRLYRDAQRLIIQDVPIVFFYFPKDLKAMSTKVQGYENLGDFRLNLFNVSLSK